MSLCLWAFPVFLAKRTTHTPITALCRGSASIPRFGREEAGGYSHKSKNESFGPGGRNDLAVSAANGESGEKEEFRAAPTPALGGFPGRVAFRIHT